MLNSELAMRTLSLAGSWEFRFEDEAGWRPIAVPGCWEEAGAPKDRPGPAWYRTVANIPAAWAGARLWLRFGAVSYDCTVFVNGAEVGRHTGAWDAFAVEITGAAHAGAPAEVLVRVEKPASLRAGPGSEALPGAFPLCETLSGFLPYVWGHMFGGIWQEAALAATGAAVFGDVHLRGGPDGRVSLRAELSAPAPLSLELSDPTGRVLLRETLRAEQAQPHGQGVSFPASGSDAAPAGHRLSPGGQGPPATTQQATFVIPEPRPWSPHDPALYTARLSTPDGDARTVRFGLRTLAADGATIRLNGAPVYPRLALSWGWYAGMLHPNPGPARVRADLLRLRSLGYNGVKLCLWVPPPYYFDLADELGMLLWLELPMWLPQVTPFFRAQTPAEYERIVRQVRNHPSMIVYTLGCELNRAVGPEVLGSLYALVKGLAGDALVRDNSGSGEAYGGLLVEYADFYDYHFYSDLPFLRGLLDSFAPRWRPAQPWLFGEFCDYDAFRDPRPPGGRSADGGRPPNAGQSSGIAETGPAGVRPASFVRRGSRASHILQQAPLPWWRSPDPAVNPQGARWLMDAPYQEERLRAAGLLERGAELEAISVRHALLHRKYTLELVRAYHEVSGYVVTGEADTPISTAGMWDDAGRLRFAPEAFRAFNDDLVALVGWGRRRAWVAGGDRAAPWDVWSYPAGALVRPHLIAAHYGRARGPAHVAWSVAWAEGEREPQSARSARRRRNAPEPDGMIASGEHLSDVVLAPGDLREVAVAEFLAPEVASPRRATLRVTLRIGSETARNAWPLWFFPRDPWAGLEDVALVDPSGRLGDWPLNARRWTLADGRWTVSDGQSSTVQRLPAVLVATAWTPEVRGFVEAGGQAVLLQAGGGPPGPLPTVALPFWREALRLVEPHPAWGDFPHEGFAGLQFFGCATDHALDSGAFPGARPILRRLDMRTMYVHDYAAEVPWGAGRLIVSTLRFEGGLGEQPLGISRNTAAAWLLGCWVRYLANGG